MPNWLINDLATNRKALIDKTCHCTKNQSLVKLSDALWDSVTAFMGLLANIVAKILWKCFKFGAFIPIKWS